MLNNMKIGKRLLFAFGVVVAFMVLMTGAAIIGMNTIQEKLDRIVNVNSLRVRLANDASKGIHIISRVSRTIVLLDSKEAKTREMKKIEDARQTYREAMAKLAELDKTEHGQMLIDRIKDATSVAAAANNRVIALGMENRQKEALAVLINEAGPLTQKAQEAFDEMLRYQEELTAKRYEEAVSAYHTTIILMVVFALVAIAAAVALALVITRSIVAPMVKAVGVAEKVSAGDLTAEIEVTSRDETGQLMQALKVMNENLVRIVSEVRQGADSIATATTQISSGNGDLSQRTEEQASALEETASSMEELTSTVKQNAENSHHANQLALNANEIAKKGGEVVGKVVTTMDAITGSSRKIGEIISVIDSIAFQTNILALNAAVEAARAGQQGRGFAVVAGEVRNLAQRSAAAAKEIKTLISDSVEKVEHGGKLVVEAGQTIDEVVTSVRRVTDIMAEITAASQEQSSGIEQVNQAITQMDEVTQQNAALVEEAAAAAESLDEQVQTLVDLVATFKLAEEKNQRHSKRERSEPSRKGEVRPSRFSGRFSERVPEKKAERGARRLSKPSKAIGLNEEWEEF